MGLVASTLWSAMPVRRPFFKGPNGRPFGFLFGGFHGGADEDCLFVRSFVRSSLVFVSFLSFSLRVFESFPSLAL